MERDLMGGGSSRKSHISASGRHSYTDRKTNVANNQQYQVVNAGGRNSNRQTDVNDIFSNFNRATKAIATEVGAEDVFYAMAARSTQHGITNAAAMADMNFDLDMSDDDDEIDLFANFAGKDPK